METGGQGFAPRTIAGVYAVGGTTWILLSDRAVATLVSDPSLVAIARTANGWAFVAFSTAVIYGLAAQDRRSLERTADRLDRAVQQTSILHRILRHNLRNTCNVIQGNVQLLRERGDDLDDECVDAIEAQTDALLEIAEKTRLLRDVASDDPPKTITVDVATLVDDRVDVARDRFQDAEFRVETPVRASARAHPRIDTAIDELLENAVVHADDEPVIEVSVRAGTDAVELAITDDGPGLPRIERAVLEADVERQTVHSEGIGLWLVRTIVTEGGGDVRVGGEDTSAGAVVTVAFEPPGESSDGWL